MHRVPDPRLIRRSRATFREKGVYRFRNWCIGFDLRFGVAGGWGHDRGSCLSVWYLIMDRVSGWLVLLGRTLPTQGTESPAHGELAQLRGQLARDLATTSDIARGRAASPTMDRLEERAADLETDNARLRQQVGRLEADTEELSENLEAARDMNRELMNAVNCRGQNRADTSLADRAARFATGLTDLGVRPGDRLVVLMANCPEVLITYRAAPSWPACGHLRTG
jgi:hypothetical protein